MKKKLLSSEALAALVKGPAVPTPEPGADAGDQQIETTIETPAEPSADSEAEAETDVQAELEAKVAELTEAATKVTELEAKVAELEAKVSDIAAVEAMAGAKVKAATEEAEVYRGIVVGHIATMRTALNLAAVDMANWTNEAVLREYNSIADSFEKALPEGSQVPESQPAEQKPTMSSLDAGKFNQLGF
jgi:type V secretory pathway adhesin AidA